MVKKLLSKEEVHNLQNGEKVIIGEQDVFIEHIVTQPYAYFDKKKGNFSVEQCKCLVDTKGFFYKLDGLDLNEIKVYKEVEGLSPNEIQNYFNLATLYNFKFIGMVVLAENLYRYVIIENNKQTIEQQCREITNRSYMDIVVKMTFTNDFNTMYSLLSGIVKDTYKEKTVSCSSDCPRLKGKICCINCDETNNCNTICEFIDDIHSENNLDFIFDNCEFCIKGEK